MIKNTYTIILSFVVLGLLGVLALPKVPLRLTSGQEKSMLTVSYSWPNAAPEALERQVTAPMEGVLGILQGVTHISSYSEYNTGSITLELDKKIDADQVRFEAASLLRQIYRNLPFGVSYPIISMNSASENKNERPLLSLQLNGSEGSGKLRKYMEDLLKPKLARLEGIRSVDMHGGGSDEWLVQYEPTLLNSLGISERMISQAIRESDQKHNIGWINIADGLRQSVAVTPHTFTREDFLEIPIIKKEGRIIRLGDVTTVQKKDRPASTYFRINGRNALQVVLTAQSDVNQLSVASRARELVKTIQKELPKGYGIRIDYDATDYIYENLKNTGKQATTAVIFILILSFLIFRQWKAVLITILAMTITLLLGALVFFTLKINIQSSSLTALIPAIGLITGNTWVMFHHYWNWGTRSVIRPFLGATLIMCATFAVVRLLPQEIQYELKGFAVLLITLQVLSLCVCNWFVPALMEQLRVSIRQPRKLSSLFLKKSGEIYWVILKLMHRFKVQNVILAILLFGIPVYQLPQRLDEKAEYANIYNKTIGSEWFSEHGRIYLNKGLGGTLRLFTNYVYNKSSYASDKQTVLYIRAGLPNQSTVEQMDAILIKLENELGKYREIDRFISQVDNGQQGAIVIYFKKPHDQGHFPYQLKARIIALSTEMSGIDWNIYGVGQGFNVNLGGSNTQTFNLTLKGYNYKELGIVTVKLKDKLLAHPRIQEVDINKEPGVYRQRDLFVYRLNTNGYYWGEYGISENALYGAIYPFNARPQPDLYQLTSESYEGINIQPVTAGSFDLTALRLEPMVLPESIGLKLGGYAKLTKEKITPNIRKEDQEYLRLVTFNYIGNDNFREIFLAKTLKAFEQELPMGYSAKMQSYGWWQIEAHQQYEFVALSLFFIFIIGAVFFESLRQPLTLIIGIVLSFIGLFLAFYFTDVGFDQGGYASFLLVTGVTSQSLIMIIDTFNIQLSKKERSRSLGAYFQTILIGLAPTLYFLIGILVSLIAILMCSMEQPFWYALCIGTVGGIFASAIVVLFFVPLFLVSQFKGNYES